MGADGSIQIFNWSKAREKYPQLNPTSNYEGKDEYLRYFIGGYIYNNPFIEGNELLVTYAGDNLFSSYGIYYSFDNRWEDMYYYDLSKKEWWNEDVKNEWKEIVD